MKTNRIMFGGSYFEDVGLFHEKFDLPVTGKVERGFHGGRPSHMERVALREAAYLVEQARDLLRGYVHPMLFREAFSLEEQAEGLRAAADDDLPRYADALADRVYVDLGSAHYCGIPFDGVWAEVQRANMEKERAQSAEESKRGSTLDVVKPEGWRAPDVAGVLAR